MIDKIKKHLPHFSFQITLPGFRAFTGMNNEDTKHKFDSVGLREMIYSNIREYEMLTKSTEEIEYDFSDDELHADVSWESCLDTWDGEELCCDLGAEEEE